jgi:hypothetical protein
MLNANDGYDEWRLDWYDDAHGGMTKGSHNPWCRRSHHSICHLMISSKEPVSPAITEEAKVLLKNQEGKCVVEDLDNIPRNNSDCPYILLEIASQ